MRKLNMFVVIAMLVTFLAHGIMGSFKLFGADANTLKHVARLGVGLVVVHMVIVTILTVKTLYARHKSGAGYFKGNGLFWTRRLSGFAVIIPLVMHLTIFTTTNSDAFRLEVFNTGRLISQILLVVTLLVHVISNIRPLFIGLGIKGFKRYLADILLVLSIILFVFAVAFAVYYIRWMRL